MSVEHATQPTSPWRARLGVTIFVLGFAAPALIPLVTASRLPGGLKTILAGALAFGIPELMMLAAAGVMGREGFAAMKRRIGGFFGRHGPPREVGPVRYKIGLVMFALPILLGFAGPYLGGHLPGFETSPMAWHLGGDVMLAASLFVLGGDFWDKLRALFVHRATVTFPAPEAEDG